MKLLKFFTPIVSFLFFVLAWVTTRPLNIKRLRSHTRPTAGYLEAIDRVEVWQSEQARLLHPACRPQLLSHGRQTERVIVFWHGFTSCPQQFRQLGEMFFERGYNVLLPRMPHHGLADRMTTEQARLTAEELVAWADETLDVARGLGQHVTVFGFSVGGVLAGWAAHHRPDVDRVVILAPAFWLRRFPLPLAQPLINLFLVLPNMYRWWNPLLKTGAPGPQYAYPRFSSRALAQILRLGQAVQAAARRSKPAAPSILMITNPNDWAVDNDVAAKIAAQWRARGGNVQTYAFDASLGLPHDLVSPEQAHQQVDTVYPILLKLVAENN